MTPIKDRYNRTIHYLRLAVTDKCNMRCEYCLPLEGVKFLPKKQLLSYEEMLRLCRILVDAGITKIRLTGGEPFLRKNLMYFIRELSNFFPANALHITTNGTLIHDHLTELFHLGVKNINLSIDSLNKERFEKITNTTKYAEVVECLNQMVEMGFNLKLNTVVLQDKNTMDIHTLALLTKEMNIQVRFIEEMPFNGYGKDYENWKWDHLKILHELKTNFPGLIKSQQNSKTAVTYQVKGFAGSLGIIPAWSRTICGECNRMRITPEGKLRTCLYDEGVFSLRDVMRSGASDAQILNTLQEAFKHKAKDGFEAQKLRGNLGKLTESMATIGG